VENLWGGEYQHGEMEVLQGSNVQHGCAEVPGVKHWYCHVLKLINKVIKNSCMHQLMQRLGLPRFEKKREVRGQGRRRGCLSFGAVASRKKR
jgi:hypothetical protein